MNELSEMKVLLHEWNALYKDELLAWAIVKVRSKEVAEDLLQEAFIAAYNSYEGFQFKCSPKTWLFKILNNKIIDHFRALKRSGIVMETYGNQLVDSDFFVSEFWEDLAEQEERNQFEYMLFESLEELPEKWNLILTYKYFLDLPTEVICTELNLTLFNYWQIIHRAKLVLKKIIEIKRRRLSNGTTPISELYS